MVNVYIYLSNAAENEWNQYKYWIDLKRTLWLGLILEQN